MDVIKSTKLWNLFEARKATSRGTAGTTQALEQRFAERLRQSFIQFRDRVALLASQIDNDFRSLTVHDITHIDALWQCADLLLGDDFSMNPAEVYVLGGAFLLHDAGLALSSYPGHELSLRSNEAWRDSVASVFRRSYRRSIREHEFNELPSDVRKTATENFLRSNHARNAQGLGITEFRHNPEDQGEYLIEDSTLRNAYGRLIGRIAYSHWWSADVVASAFQENHGAPSEGPPRWTVDSLRLALILRCADSLQIDSRRAPLLLRALRKPTGTSDNHWVFQSRMLQPSARNGGVLFTATTPFELKDADAWWVGSELLNVVDKELRDADRILRETNRTSFAVTYVVGCHDSKELIKQVPVVGWYPVEAKLQVSNVASLVNRLGGNQLYGDNPHVALRELIQNGRDAVIAKRLKYDLEPSSGQITVSLKESNGKFTLAVSDTGIGMSQKTLSEALLDFGTSYWYSPSMIDEHPGLAAKGFDPTGEFGIGFFSVFMLGDEVKVITRRAEDGVDETRVLDFTQGISQRVILRRALPGEERHESGTTVEVVLQNNPFARGGLLGASVIMTRGSGLPYLQHNKQKEWSLNQLCQWLAPALDVNLVTSERGQTALAVEALDWITMEPERLLLRSLLYHDDYELIRDSHYLSQFADGIRTIRDSTGVTIGRATLIDEVIDGVRFIDNQPSMNGRLLPVATVTAGQFRSAELWNMCGLVLGMPQTAARYDSRPIFQTDPISLAEWATSQAAVVGRRSSDPIVLHRYAALIRVVGGRTGDLPILRVPNGRISFDQLSHNSELPTIIELVQDSWGVHGHYDFPLTTNQIAVSSGKMRPAFFNVEVADDPHQRSELQVWKRYWMSLWGAAIEAIAIAWGMNLDEVIRASSFAESATEPVSSNGNTIRFTSDVIRKPG